MSYRCRYCGSANPGHSFEECVAKSPDFYRQTEEGQHNMKYEARYGTDLVARARSVWGIRRKAKRWCKSKENRMMRQPKLENIRFYKVTFDAFGSPHTERIQVKP